MAARSARAGAGQVVVVGLIALALLGAAGADPGGIDPPADLARPCRYFTWADLTRSGAATARGLDNRPPSRAVYLTLSRTARNILDPLVDLLPYRVSVSSGYRSPRVNRAVGGYIHSDHLTGEGLDVVLYGTAGPLSSQAAARAIINARVPFDTLIWYGSDNHVHLSWHGGGGRRRIQFATSHGATPVDRLPLVA